MQFGSRYFLFSNFQSRKIPQISGRESFSSSACIFSFKLLLPVLDLLDKIFERNQDSAGMFFAMVIRVARPLCATNASVIVNILGLVFPSGPLTLRCNVQYIFPSRKFLGAMLFRNPLDAPVLVGSGVIRPAISWTIFYSGSLTFPALALDFRDSSFPQSSFLSSFPALNVRALRSVLFKTQCKCLSIPKQFLIVLFGRVFPDYIDRRVQRRVLFTLISILQFAVSLSIIYNSCGANYFTLNVLRRIGLL